MKKILLLTILSTMLLFTACGADEAESSTDLANTMQTEGEVKNTSAPIVPTEAPTMAPTAAPTATPESTPSPAATWLTENQITITPQGDFSLIGNLYNVNTYELLDTVTSASHITITETTENVPEGYKKVIATKTTDAAYADKYGMNTALKEWFSAFDRYTGYSLEATTGTGSRENSFLLNVNGKDYDISFQFSQSGSAKNAVSTIEIICPVDYDGAVFQTGPSSLYDEIIWSMIDMSERLYTIDEFPFFGEDFLYFTYTDK